MARRPIDAARRPWTSQRERAARPVAPLAEAPPSIAEQARLAALQPEPYTPSAEEKTRLTELFTSDADAFKAALAALRQTHSGHTVKLNLGVIANANLHGYVPSDFDGCDLKGTIFQDATLQEATLVEPKELLKAWQATGAELEGNVTVGKRMFARPTIPVDLWALMGVQSSLQDDKPTDFRSFVSSKRNGSTQLLNMKSLNVQGANLSSFTEADFAGVKLKGARFENAIIPTEDLKQFLVQQGVILTGRIRVEPLPIVAEYTLATQLGEALQQGEAEAFRRLMEPWRKANPGRILDMVAARVISYIDFSKFTPEDVADIDFGRVHLSYAKVPDDAFYRALKERGAKFNGLTVNSVDYDNDRVYEQARLEARAHVDRLDAAGESAASTAHAR